MGHLATFLSGRNRDHESKQLLAALYIVTQPGRSLEDDDLPYAVAPEDGSLTKRIMTAHRLTHTCRS
jgi:hypothetical protein